MLVAETINCYLVEYSYLSMKWGTDEPKGGAAWSCPRKNNIIIIITCLIDKSMVQKIKNVKVTDKTIQI